MSDLRVTAREYLGEQRDAGVKLRAEIEFLKKHFPATMTGLDQAYGKYSLATFRLVLAMSAVIAEGQGRLDWFVDSLEAFIDGKKTL